jgi:peptidoglycan hydrolase-like protein with peptidoglycan-binding domain
MKKFRIDENERERILNMHIEATKKQYLSESIISEQPYFLTPQETFQIQHGLNDYFKTKGVKIQVVPDGAWGPKTIDALKKFQQMEGLESDGKMGPKTMAKLKEVGINEDIIDKLVKFFSGMFK